MDSHFKPCFLLNKIFEHQLDNIIVYWYKITVPALEKPNGRNHKLLGYQC